LNLDISQRAEEYLRNSGSTDDHFALPPSFKFDFVHEEALHAWVSRQMNMKQYNHKDKESNSDTSFSYGQLSRVRNQLLSNMDNTGWSLDIGGGWIVSRVGRMLRVRRSIDIDDESGSCVKEESWKVLDVSTINSSSESPSTFLRSNLTNAPHQDQVGNGSDTCCTVSLSPLFFDDAAFSSDGISPENFVIKRVSQLKAGTRFTPPWRKKHDSQLKLKAFLRGQGVPLHQRDSSPVLCFLREKNAVDTVDTVVAVCITTGTTKEEETQGMELALFKTDDLDDDAKWIIDAKYCPTSTFKAEEEQDEIVVTLMEVDVD
jgi:hypothetical protein